MKLRTRRLAFERCEDRRLLAGTSPTINLSLSPVASEGGFLTVHSSGFLQVDANHFLDSDSEGMNAGDFTFFDAGHVVSLGQIVGTSEHGRTFNGLDVIDALDLELLLPKSGDPISLDDGKVPTETPVDRIVGDSLDDSPDGGASDTPGLRGKTARMLVIVEPIQIATSSGQTNREGGTLEVAAVVHATQSAYETQLSAVLAHKLNRDTILPATLPKRLQPVVAELARAVAFETVEMHKVAWTHEAETNTEGQLEEPIPLTPRMSLEPTTAVQRTSAKEATTDAPATHTSEAPLRTADPSKNLAERVENEQQITHATNFAQWPVLATVVAGYLFVERRSLQAAQTVQKPPRRNRQTPVK